jgi:hypothetical protein
MRDINRSRSGRLRPRFWGEATLAVAAAVLVVITLLRRSWIEMLFRVEPDRETEHWNGYWWQS